MLKYYFRLNEDLDYVLSGDIKFTCIAFLVSSYLLFFYFNNRGKFSKENKTILKITSIICIVMQFAMIVWYCYYSDNFVQDGLPLYHCRISMFVISFAILFDKEDTLFVKYLALFSIFGASIAFILPDFHHFNPPHITTTNFIVSHSILLFNSLSVLSYSQNKLRFKNIAIIAFSLNLPIFLIDIFVKANYAYLISLPINYQPIKNNSFIIVILGSMFVVSVTNKIFFKYFSSASTENKSYDFLLENKHN